ncbi:unnamed protein product [Durusdinium trenchii]|uniref:EF-hand domain-containing protein n=1 Tax=Durusdinium trenchii TaxID=1381693 RepID=A0ABP0P6R2_9DINO
MAELQPHARSVSRDTHLSQPLAPVVLPEKRLATCKENGLEVALLDLAAQHVTESQQLHKKLEAAIRELEVQHFPVSVAVIPDGDASSSEREETKEVDISPAPSQKGRTRSTGYAVSRLLQGSPAPARPTVPMATGRSADAVPTSAAPALRAGSAAPVMRISNESKASEKRRRNSRAPETLRLKKQLNQANQKVISADYYGDLDPEDDGERTWYQNWSLLALVSHPVFDAWTALVILVNAATIGAETQYGAMAEELPSSLEAVSQVCSFYFLLELILRIGAHKASWCADPDMRLWNLFDLLLVSMSLIDFMIFRVLQNGAGFTEVKLLKTLRIMRVFRVFRFFRQLTQLALMITDSIRSLIWALVLLAIIIYAFAIFLTANVSSWLHLHLGSPGSEWPTLAAEHSDADIRILEFAYGSLPQTVYTLVQAVLGGRSWHEVCTPLFKVGWLPVMLLFIYVSFVILAVLNVVTGVFVDNAFRCAEKQRSLAIQKEMDKKEQFVQEITDFFRAMDQDGSGDVTAEELGEMLDDPALSAYFRVLGFDIDDARRFILLLDTDANGSISVSEFLRGCLRYRGVATGVDMHTCLRVVRRMEKTIHELETGLLKRPAPASHRLPAKSL